MYVDNRVYFSISLIGIVLGSLGMIYPGFLRMLHQPWGLFIAPYAILVVVCICTWRDTFKLMSSMWLSWMQGFREVTSIIAVILISPLVIIIGFAIPNLVNLNAYEDRVTTIFIYSTLCIFSSYLLFASTRFGKRCVSSPAQLFMRTRVSAGMPGQYRRLFARGRRAPD